MAKTDRTTMFENVSERRVVVFDNDADITAVPSASVFREGGRLLIQYKQLIGNHWIASPPRQLDASDGDIFINYLIHEEPHNKVYPRIQGVVRDILWDQLNYRMAYKKLVSAVCDKASEGAVLVKRTLKMMVAIGEGIVVQSGKTTFIELSPEIKEVFNSKKFLMSLADDLLSKSKRIKLLLSHGPTVGNYREELLRNLLINFIPSQYEVSTGFVAGCSKQIDILVWDKTHYSPLFREQHLVVVPLEAVRCVIEVKTVLTKEKLTDAMLTLDAVAQRQVPLLPIFKAIFAFETKMTETTVVKAMIANYRGDGTVEAQRHTYFWSGVNAVCVPSSILIRERYSGVESEGSDFPQPELTTIESDWTGDKKTAFFLSLLLSHLDLPVAAKRQNAELMLPITSGTSNKASMAIYTSWAPKTSHMATSRSNMPEGARAYCQNVHAFRAGKMTAAEATANLSWFQPDAMVVADQSNS